jgi:ParB family chromosome partitioning protein
MRIELDAPPMPTSAADVQPNPLDDLLVAEAGEGAPSHQIGAPLMLQIDTIEEDPLQPRQEFDRDLLEQLAASIEQRGVIQAISVRAHPEHPQRWMLNFGARRLRASRIAGRAEIPAYVDETADSYVQIIENEQREGLKPLELALFIQQRIAKGDTQAEIARNMGKGRAHVTMAMALIDAPHWLMAAYREGRCRGVREIYELRQLHERLGRQVEDWAAMQANVTRSELAALKASEDAPDRTQTDGNVAKPEAVPQDAAGQIEGAAPRTACLSPADASTKAQAKASLRSARTANAPMQGLVIEVDVDGQVAELVLDRLPTATSQVFVITGSGTDARPVDIDSVSLRRLVRR